MLGHMFGRRKRNRWERREEMFYLTRNSILFIYGYMASDIWYKTTQIAREETRCHHMGYSFLVAARVLLYASSHRQDNTYHNLCYTSHGALAGTKNYFNGISLYILISSTILMKSCNELICSDDLLSKY